MSSMNERYSANEYLRMMNIISLLQEIDEGMSVDELADKFRLPAEVVIEDLYHIHKTAQLRMYITPADLDTDDENFLADLCHVFHSLNHDWGDVVPQSRADRLGGGGDAPPAAPFLFLKKRNRGKRKRACGRRIKKRASRCLLGARADARKCRGGLRGRRWCGWTGEKLAREV